MIDYKELQSEIRAWAINKGWLDIDADPRPLNELLMLIVTEVAESVEAHRAGDPPCTRDGMEHLSHMAEELADVTIRLVQMADEWGITVAGSMTPYFEGVVGMTPLQMHWGIVRCAINFEEAAEGSFKAMQSVEVEMMRLLGAVEYVAHTLDVNLKEAVELKMAFNWTRPHKHNKAC